MHSFKGKNNPNYKGGKKKTKCKGCSKQFSYYPSLSRGKFCCKECFNTSGHMKVVMSEKFKNHISKTPEKQLFKTGLEYKKWHKEVMARDGWKCVQCGSKKDLQVDHIMPMIAVFLEYQITNDKSLLLDLDNGQTICLECHKKTDTWGARAFKDPTYLLIKTIMEMPIKKSKCNEKHYREQVEKIIGHIKTKLD